jgi:DNA-binding transcriptional LysR family regulator
MNSYVAVCKARSFTGAAKQLGVSGSLMSRHIAWLEGHLGVRLINRTARSISLTEHGKSYLQFCERVLKEIEQEEASVRSARRRPEGTLSILSPKWIGSLDVADAVAEFSLAHPRIEVSFDIGMDTDRPYDFVDQGYDAAFQTRNLRDSLVRVRRVATLPFVLCAAPKYLQRTGSPTRVSELAHHQCLIHKADPTWQLEFEGAPMHYKINQPGFTSNTYLVLQKASLRGLGIAMLPLRPIYEDLQSGRLERVLEDYSVPTRPLYIAYPPGLQSLERLRLFVDFVGDWFKRFPIGESDQAEMKVPVSSSPGASR